MEEHKQYLSDDADETERRAAELVMEGLAGLRLEAKVAQVAAERAAFYRRRFWRRVFFAGGALTLLASAVYFFLGKKAMPAPSPPIEQPKDPSILRPNPVPSADKKSSSGPIAQLRPDERLPPTRDTAPGLDMIRGDAAADKKTKHLLDQVWYTDYPLKGLRTGDAFAKADELLKKRDFEAAYLELEDLEGQFSQNDTLRYLWGYCLLELGAGEEALEYFNALQGRHKDWEAQLQWYRGLALLLVHERAKALALFRQLAAQPKHPYRRQAEKAVRVFDF